MSLAAGDADALAVAYQPLALKIAQRYAHVMAVDELRSEAVLILLLVAREFSTAAPGCSFATFATYRVQQRLVDFIRGRLGRYGQRGSWERLMVDVDEVYHDDAPPSRDDTEGRVLQNELARQLSLAIGMLETDLAHHNI
jgi:DNA-directed RNA polymerase specialized sigma24 family protein